MSRTCVRNCSRLPSAGSESNLYVCDDSRHHSLPLFCSTLKSRTICMFSLHTFLVAYLMYYFRRKADCKPHSLQSGTDRDGPGLSPRRKGGGGEFGSVRRRQKPKPDAASADGRNSRWLTNGSIQVNHLEFRPVWVFMTRRWIRLNPSTTENNLRPILGGSLRKDAFPVRMCPGRLRWDFLVWQGA